MNKILIKPDDMDKIKLPPPPELEHFEYRDQFYDSDSFKDIEEWSKLMVAEINAYNKQVQICFNNLIDLTNSYIHYPEKNNSIILYLSIINLIIMMLVIIYLIYK